MSPISDTSHSSEAGRAADRKIALMTDLLEQLQEHSDQLRDRERSLDRQQSEDPEHLSQSERDFGSEGNRQAEWGQREQNIVERETSLANEQQKLEESRTALETERFILDEERQQLQTDRAALETSRIELKQWELEMRAEIDSLSVSGGQLVNISQATDEVAGDSCLEADSMSELEDLYEIEAESDGDGDLPADVDCPRHHDDLSAVSEDNPPDSEPVPSASSTPDSLDVELQEEEDEAVAMTGLSSARFLNYAMDAPTPQNSADKESNSRPKSPTRGSAESKVAQSGEPDRRTGEVEESNSMTAYMERLLGKKLEPSTGSAATPGSSSVVPETTHAQDNSRKVKLRQTPPKPRTAPDLDEIRAGIDSMRELANLTARSAIARSSWKRFRGSRFVKAILAGVASVVCIALSMSPSLFQVDLRIFALPVLAVMMVTSLDFARSIFAKINKQAASASDPSPKRNDPEESSMNKPQD